MITLIYYIVEPLFHASNLRPILRPINDPCGAIGWWRWIMISEYRPAAVRLRPATGCCIFPSRLQLQMERHSAILELPGRDS